MGLQGSGLVHHGGVWRTALLAASCSLLAACCSLLASGFYAGWLQLLAACCTLPCRLVAAARCLLHVLAARFHAGWWPLAGQQGRRTALPRRAVPRRRSSPTRVHERGKAADTLYLGHIFSFVVLSIHTTPHAPPPSASFFNGR